jgi:CheY-like chemotaxis protein
VQRILLIDDDGHVRNSLALALRAKGFDVVAADGGAAGLRAFGEGAFDLAIVDVFMPGMDGVKLIKALRERSPNLPLIAVSGVALPLSGRTALDLFPRAPGLSDVVCLQKPFRTPELLQAIVQAIGIGRPVAATV